MAAIVGKWTFVSEENFVPFMDAVGIPDDMKKIAAANKPNLLITKEGDTYVMKTTIADKVKETRFKPGEPFEGLSLSMQPMKSIVNIEGSKLIEKQTFGDYTVTVTREVNGDELTSIMEVNNVKAVLKFKRD